MSQEQARRALAASTLFGVLPPEAVAALAEHGRVRSYERGEQVFARGDLGGPMYVLAAGSLALSVTSADGGEVVLAVLRAPQTFGELAMLDDGPRVATATAREPLTVVALPASEVRRLLRTQPLLAEAMLIDMAALVRRVDDALSDLILLDLRTRVGKFLRAAASASPGPRAAGDVVAVDVRLSQTELARLVGGSRQQVNRAIGELESAGAVHRAGSRIVAVRPHLLPGGE